ncbi:ImmA/IrrE family metallo-endopeptidase [Bacillus infantis]|uniref:ImmA/IrrE family metallo-endopeptidase n=1 Tax=Bacillus infantis TaxID=324767 RepID=UPI003CEFA2EC
MIPNEVNIAGINYTVKEEANMNAHYNLLGQIFYTKGIIKLDAGMSEERKERTFIHELLHGIFYEAGYEEQDEDMINRVGIVLHQVLKDNKLDFKSPYEALLDIPLVGHPNTPGDDDGR